MSVRKFIEEFIASIVEAHLPSVMEPSAPTPENKTTESLSRDLFVGQILTDGTLKCEVVQVHKTNIHVKILEIYWDRFGTYLDVGKTYPVFKHRNNPPDMEVWEISPKHMKRSSSQVLLFWFDYSGWSWDLDC